jgi:hypothetical protein
LHLTADIIGERHPLLSMTALRAAALGGRAAIIDKSGALAKLAAANERRRAALSFAPHLKRNWLTADLGFCSYGRQSFVH